MSFRIRAYRQLARAMVKQLAPARAKFELGSSSPEASRAPRIWFHAASVGELEMLWPVIEQMAREGRELCLTIFSRSAEKALGRLESRCRELHAEFASSQSGAVPAKPVFLKTGYSPGEGYWGEALAQVDPALFVTCRYEAWPELWWELSDRKIPLLIVGARARRSLRLAKVICSGIGAALPHFYLGLIDANEEPDLKRLFAAAETRIVGDPRWDRMASRIQSGNPRAAALFERFASLPKPWGILGQIWPEDLVVWRDVLRRGTTGIWLVPHQVDEASLQPILEALKDLGTTFVRTTEPWLPTDGAAPIILVDELGFLAELYRMADWAYVGGGFGKQIHSALEPAAYGLPISIGPRGSTKFPEVEALRRLGQIQVLERKTTAPLAWLDQLPGIGQSKRAAWKSALGQRLGSTRRISEWIREILNGGRATDL